MKEKWEKDFETFFRENFMLSGSIPSPKGTQRVNSSAWNCQEKTKSFIRQLLKDVDEKWEDLISDMEREERP